MTLIFSYKLTSLHTVTKISNCNIWFSVAILRVEHLPVICDYLRYETVLSFYSSIWRGKVSFRDQKETHYSPRDIVIPPKKNGFALVLFKTIWYEKRIGFYLCIWNVLWNVSSDWEGTNWLRSLIQNFNASKGFTEWKTIYLFPLDKYTLFMLRLLKNIYLSHK